MSNTLVIGDTSQLSYYLPKSFDKISSRNIDYSSMGEYERIYICFAEQRTFKSDANFIDINYHYTLDVIDKILPKTNEVVFYSTAMLWQNLEQYDITDEFSYDENSKYLVSKEMISKELEAKEKTIVHYPCNFNSCQRKKGYLFSKLIDACSGKSIEAGNLNFDREIVHASYIAEVSTKSKCSQIIAPGYLVNIESYFRDVIDAFGYKFIDLVFQNLKAMSTQPKSVHKCIDMDYSYGKMLEDTIEDIKIQYDKNKEN